MSRASSCPMFEWHKIENASGVFFSSSVTLKWKEKENNEWMNEWINEWMNEWIFISRKRKDTFMNEKVWVTKMLIKVYLVWCVFMPK